MEKIIIIAGPTGVGKSELAELLAQQVNGEIINADQGQLYEPLSIGTAKPDWKNHAIKHHLFDVVMQPHNFSNAEYQKTVRACITDVQARGKTAIVVGGSGFYYQMLLFNFFSPSTALRCAQGERGGVAARGERSRIHGGSWKDLHAIDPDRAAAIHPNDHYRITRALEIYYTHNILPSQHGLTYAPFAPYSLIHVNRTTQDLYNRINQRAHSMLEHGWLQEAAKLPSDWKEFVKIKKIIGYNDILEYQDGHINYETLIATIQKKTRNYAKRQKTYFRSLLKKIPETDHTHIQEINLTLSSVDLYLNQLIKCVGIR